MRRVGREFGEWIARVLIILAILNFIINLII
jgi:hypothetical protein